MVDAGAHYDHRSAFAVDGVLRKFSCNLCDQLRLYIRVFLLPGRSVGPVIFICCRCVTGYTAVDTGLGAHDIEYRGDEYRTCVCLYLPDRYIPLKDVIAGFLERSNAERLDAVFRTQERKRRGDVFHIINRIGRRMFQFELPSHLWPIDPFGTAYESPS